MFSREGAARGVFAGGVLLATQLERTRRLDRCLRAVDVDLRLGVPILVILRTGLEKVCIAGHAAACACRWVCCAGGSLLFGCRLLFLLFPGVRGCVLSIGGLVLRNDLAFGRIDPWDGPHLGQPA